MRTLLWVGALAALTIPAFGNEQAAPVLPNNHIVPKSQCPSTKKALAYALTQLGEIPAGAGKSLSTPGYDVVLTLNEQKGTFSVLIQKPDGTLCPVIQGGGLVLRSVAA